MIKANDVINTKIITLSDGREVGRVKDVVYDPSSHYVRAFLIDEGGWFSDAHVILIRDIHSIGHDAILVKDQSAVQRARDVANPVAAIAKGDTYLTNTKIITEDGKELGQVTDLYFDPKSGQVTEFDVSGGMFSRVQSGNKRVKVADIITIGRDATIVRSYVDSSFEAQSRKQGVKGAVYKTKEEVSQSIHRAKEEAPGIVETIQEKAGGLTNQAREKFQEARNHPNTRHAVQRVRDASERIQDTVRGTVENLKDKAQEVRTRPAAHDAANAAFLQGYKAREDVEKKAGRAQDAVHDQAAEYRAKKQREENATEDEIAFTPAPDMTEERYHGTAGGSTVKTGMDGVEKETK